MKWHRINAMLIRHLYLYKRSVPRLMDVFFWPFMTILLWGFISLYLQKSNFGGGLNIITILLGATLFWQLLNESEHAISIAFLEEVWEKNFLNIFVTPLKLSEFIVSTTLLGLVRIFLVGVVMTVISFFAYSFNVFSFGIYLVPFALNLLLFGLALGLVMISIILRFGTSAQVLAFGIMFLIQPFSAVFYPVSALPKVIQYISYIFPSTHVFEGMRAVIATGSLPLNYLLWAIGLNIIYLTLAVIFFYKMFASVKRKGRLLKMD